MATEIEGIKMARPMTHDLLKTFWAKSAARSNQWKSPNSKKILITPRSISSWRAPSDDRLAAQRCHRFRAAHQEPDLCGQGSLEARVCCSRKKAKRHRSKTFPMFPRKNGERFSKRWRLRISSTSNKFSSYRPQDSRYCLVITVIVSITHGYILLSKNHPLRTAPAPPFSDGYCTGAGVLSQTHTQLGLTLPSAHWY